MLAGIDDARKELGFIDNAIISLVLERVAVARRMGAIKREHKLPLLPEGFTMEKATAARAGKALAQGACLADVKTVERTFAVLVQAAIDAESDGSA